MSPSAKVEADSNPANPLKSVRGMRETDRPPLTGSALAPGISKITSSGRTIRPPNAAALPRKTNRRLSSISRLFEWRMSGRLIAEVAGRADPRRDYQLTSSPILLALRLSGADDETELIDRRAVRRPMDGENVVRPGDDSERRQQQKQRRSRRWRIRCA